MPKFYPERKCDIYLEKPVIYHDARPNILRNDPEKNKVCWFRDPKKCDLNHSVICSWGTGKTYKCNTRFKMDCFIKTRRVKDRALPVPGRRGMWRITQHGTAGMCLLPLHKWDIQDWLQKQDNKKKKD